MHNLKRSKTEPYPSREHLQHTRRARASGDHPSSGARKSSDHLSLSIFTVASTEASLQEVITPQCHIIEATLAIRADVTPTQMEAKSAQRRNYRPDSRTESRPDVTWKDAQAQRTKTFRASAAATATDATSHDSLEDKSSIRCFLTPQASSETFSMVVERGRLRHRSNPSAREHRCSRTSTSGSWSSGHSVSDELARELEDLASSQRMQPQRQRYDDSNELAGVGTWTGSGRGD